MTTWPGGTGEMARRIRAHDWSRTPLGPIEGWSTVQRSIVDLVLASGHAMQLAWGPQRIVLYNDAYAPMLGERHPGALGVAFRDAWPEIWGDIEPLVGRVFAGETVRFEDMPLTMTRHGYAERTWWNFSYSPVRDEHGAVVALLNVTVDATAGMRARRAESERDEASARLQISERRQAFLLHLSDALRPSMDPVETQGTAMRLLLEELEVMRASYFTVDDDQDSISVTEGHERDAAPLPRRLRLSDYAPEMAAAFRDGRTLVFRDTEHETQLGSDPAAYRPLGIRAWISVPLVKNGRLLAIVSVHSSTPRDWTEAQTRLVEDVADRTWAAVERASVENALRESERRYRELFGAAERRAAELRAVIESIGDAVYVGDARGITLANQVGLEQLGFATLDDLRRDIAVLAAEIETRDAVSGEPLSLAEQPFSRALAGAHAVRHVSVRHRRTGEERIVRSSASPVISDGQILGAVAVNTDVTIPARAEAALRDSEERQSFLLKLSDGLRAIAEPSAVKRHATALLGEELGVNRVFYADAQDGHWHVERGYEHDIEPLPDMPFEMAKYGDWIIDGFRAGVALVVSDMTADSRFSVSEREAHLALGIEAEVALPLVKNRELVAMLVVHAARPRLWSERDLALLEGAAERTWSSVERARAESALREADRRKDRFLAVLAHELRNGLAPLVYNVQLGSRSGGDAKRLQELYQRAGRQLEHMVRLVDDLLDVARIATGKIELDLEFVKLRDVVNLAIEACRSDIDRKQHRLVVVDEANEDLGIRGDKVRLTQVVSNLLSNASKYMDRGGAITLRLARDADGSLIEVRDEGIGIPPEAIPDVFELFSQVRHQQAYSEGGLGIGLSLVKELVEMHGGSVTAASRGTGEGSVFTVRLPLADGAAPFDARGSEDGKADDAARPLRVLVVDDLQEAADPLGELLQSDGCDVEVAYDGRHALDSARRRPPDLVLLDLGMPGMDGFEVVRRLRDQSRAHAMYVVALTGWGQEADRQRTHAAGFDGHLAKPPSHAELQAVIAMARRST